MIRRLVSLFVALTLVPVLLPSGAAGHFADRRHGQAAERSTSHGPIASMTESMTVRTVLLRSAHRNAWASASESASRTRGVVGAFASGSTVSHRSLQQGSATIPLRI